MRSKIVAFITVFALSCAAPAFAQTGKVVWYNSNGTKLGQEHIAAFNKHHPGVTVEMIVGGSGELLSRVKAERARPLGDVYNGSVETMAAELDLFDGYKIQEHDQFPPSAVGPEFKYYGDSLPLQVIMVNTSMTPLAQAPKT